MSEEKMNQEIKIKWLAELRSGKFKQGRMYLRQRRCDDDQFCCLGVLCHIIDPSGWGPLSTDGSTYSWGSESSRGMPPPSVLEQAGLSFSTAKQLARSNDDGLTFYQIARDIEQQL